MKIFVGALLFALIFQSGFSAPVRRLSSYGRLIDAVRSGDKASVEGELVAGVPASFINTEELIHQAAYLGHARVVRLLALYGGHIGQRNEEGQSPLGIVVFQGYVHVVAALIMLGVDLFDGEDEGESLYRMTRERDDDVLVALLDAGRWFQGEVQGSWGLLDRQGSAFTHHLAAGNHVVAMEELLRIEGMDVNAPSGRNGEDAQAMGRTPLHLAALEGHLDMVRLLLAEGAAVDALDVMRRTPLYLAAERGHVDVVLALLEEGADANARESERGYRPLHIAVERGHLGIFYELLGGGAGETLTDVEGNTPRAIAEEFNQTEMVRVFNRQNQQQRRLAAGMEPLPSNATRLAGAPPGSGGGASRILYTRVFQNYPACGR